MKTTKCFMMTAIAMTFAACSNDTEVVNDGPVAAQITAGVSGPSTRAINDTWETDAIGVMVTSSTSTSGMTDLYKNVMYTTSANTNGNATFSAVSDAGRIFFQDATETVTFAAYGPYQEGNANVLPGTDGSISDKKTDAQNTRNAQKAFDFIYASGATASKSIPSVEFKDNHSFAHKMSRLVIIVKTSATDGFTATDVTTGTYTLSGLKHNGEFNVTTGVATATGEATSNWSLTANSLKTDDETNQCTFTSILYPQTLNSALTFNANIGGQTYSNNTAINPALAAGTSYEYIITIKKTGITVSGCTITNWSTVNGGGSDATMQ